MGERGMAVVVERAWVRAAGPATADPTTAPEIGTSVDQDVDFADLAKRFPGYQVIIHDDDVHTFDDVIGAIVKSIPGTSEEEALKITLYVHYTGRGIAAVCKKEQAEYYADRLGTFGLTVSIEATK